ncbi:MAG: hypothetical protein QG622_1971 [Actinomycetota bacterium]|nr:hypothetical protein [Actinomycetota bacterium]
MALGVLTFAPSLAGGGTGFPASDAGNWVNSVGNQANGVGGRAVDAGGEAALLGTAAIAGAGTEVDHLWSSPRAERHPVRAERRLRQALRAR